MEQIEPSTWEDEFELLTEYHLFSHFQSIADIFRTEVWRMITVSQMSPVYTFVGIHKLVEEKNHHQIDLKGKKTLNIL